MSEREQALQIANRWLDFDWNPLTQMVHGDPDCDALVLARQFIRLCEELETIKAPAPTQYLRPGHPLLRGLRMVKDAALEDGKAITAMAFDQLIVALETGGGHPLLQRWVDQLIIALETGRQDNDGPPSKQGGEIV